MPRGDGPVNPERLAAVDVALRRCMSHGAIERTFSKEWQTTRRTIRRYIRRCYKAWEEDKKNHPTDNGQEFERTKQALGDAFAGAMNAQDFRGAVMAIDRRAHLLGLYPSQKHELSGPAGAPMQVEAKVDAKAELLAALQKHAPEAINEPKVEDDDDDDL